MPTALSPPPRAAASHRRWTAGRITALIIGTTLVLSSLVLLGGGGTGVWAELTQRNGGYITTSVHEFSTSGSALTTDPTHLGSLGTSWLSPGLLGKVRVRVAPTTASTPLFVGIGRSAEVDRYLAGVDRSLISEFFRDKVEAVAGGQVRALPESQKFWVASATGTGTRTLTWDPAVGSWTVVVMNADGRPGIGVRADLGARMPAVRWIAFALLVAGAILVAGGVLLIISAVRRPRAAAG